mmetsp:Transcript_7040/g.21454  ORF Transcript_7040/g.21454 Transcript_7040/m.21454 type:complete len:204 (+) Transcript_7040:89-700(+)
MEMGDLKIGVLELQGDFAEHSSMLRRLGVQVVPVRQVEHLKNIDGLVLPGGESTTIGKLLRDLNMLETVQVMAKEGSPMFGTCAGCILLAKDVVANDSLPRVGAMDMKVTRNAYGSQIDSFETDVVSEFWKGEKLHAVNIRAPAIDNVGESVSVLASYQDKPVLVRQGALLATTFHPELTDDTRVHELFVALALEAKKRKQLN